MKEKFLSFVFISFSELSLCNELRAKKIKKFPFFLTRVLGCGPRGQIARSFIPRPPLAKTMTESAAIFVSSVSGFGKQTLRLKMTAKPRDERGAAMASAIGRRARAFCSKLKLNRLAGLDPKRKVGATDSRSRNDVKRTFRASAAFHALDLAKLSRS